MICREEATRLGEQYEHLGERSHEALLRIKDKVKTAKAYLAQLQTRVSATTEEVTAILLDTSTTCSQFNRLQGYIRDLRYAQESKREALQSDAIITHADASTAYRVSNKEAIRQQKLKKHVERLKERMQVQRHQRVQLLMTEGALQIAAYKLKRKFDRLFSIFQTTDIDTIISRCHDIVIRETLHTVEAEDRLQQNAKLMETVKDLIGTMLELRAGSGAKGEGRGMDEEEYRLLGKYGARMRWAREMGMRVSATLGSWVLKFKLADVYSQLGIYPSLPTSLPTLFLSFEKIVCTALEIHRTSNPPKLKPMVVAMRHLLKGMLEPNQSRQGIPRQRVSKPFINFMTKSPASAEDPAHARIRALCREKEEDADMLSLDNEELLTAAEDMKAYKLLRRYHSEETIPQPVPVEVKKVKVDGGLSQKLVLKDVDKRLGELAKIRKRITVPARSEASEVLLTLKKTTLRMIRPLHMPPLVSTPRQTVPSNTDGSFQALPTTQRDKRPFTKAERGTLSPTLSTRSTVKDSAKSPRSDHVNRLKRLAGL